jgi:Protein of unknown function (DUF4242)
MFDGVTTTFFVVERYLPGISAEELRLRTERLALAAANLSAADEEIRYLGSAFVPEEESCFCRFEASSARLIHRACRDADFPYARIHEAEAFAYELAPLRADSSTSLGKETGSGSREER